MAVVAINVGEMQIQAVVTVPAIPARAAAEAMKRATDRIGPAAWVIAGVLTGGGIYWYCKQPPERRAAHQESRRRGRHAPDEPRYQTAAAGACQARLQLRACMVPQPAQRTPASAILRELALSPGSLSAAQLAGLLDPALRPPVADLRAFLRKHDNTLMRHMEMAEEFGHDPVQVDLKRGRHWYELTLVTKDRASLFATLTGVLAAWGMNIVKAHAFSNQAGTVVDTLYFTDRFRTLELNLSEWDRFKRSIAAVLAGDSGSRQDAARPSTRGEECPRQSCGGDAD